MKLREDIRKAANALVHCAVPQEEAIKALVREFKIEAEEAMIYLPSLNSLQWMLEEIGVEVKPCDLQSGVCISFLAVNMQAVFATCFKLGVAIQKYSANPEVIQGWEHEMRSLRTREMRGKVLAYFPLVSFERW